MADDLQNTEFLYDFIYLDRPRLSSYSAQLFDEGVLTNVKSTEQVGESSGYKGNLGLPAVAGGEAAGTNSLSHSLERQFDAAWILPINVINRLDEFGYIYRDLRSTPLGRIVLTAGRVKILDIRMMRELWTDAFALGLEQSTPQSAAKRELDAQRKHSNAMANVLSKLPHALQFSFYRDGLSAWSTLPPEHMTINPEDIAFKHGANIQGEWHMLAIVDARPDSDSPDAILDPMSEFESGIMQMLNGIKETFGRPAIAYGVTPIAIFRSLSKP